MDQQTVSSVAPVQLEAQAQVYTMPSVQQASSSQFGNSSLQNQPSIPPMASSSQYGNSSLHNQPLHSIINGSHMQYQPAPNLHHLLNAPATRGPIGQEKSTVTAMDPPSKTFQDVFENKKKQMMLDFDKVKHMTLLDNEEYLSDLYRVSRAFGNKNFLMMILCSYYRDKYKDLFDEFEGLAVFLEFVLSMIIFSSEKHLKEACASRVIRLPNNRGSNDFMALFGRKRGSNSIKNHLAAKKAKKIEHPFLKSSEYTSRQILFDIGKCCEYVVPSEFAELFANVHHGDTIKQQSSTEKNTFAGLKVTFSKAIVCLVSLKNHKSFSFLNLLHLNTFGQCLSDMTSLKYQNDSFNFGTKVKMQVEHIASSKIDQIDLAKVTDGYPTVVINSITINKLSNGSLIGKAYADVGYVIPSIKMDKNEETNCQNYVETFADEYEKTINEYNKSINDVENQNQGASTSIQDNSANKDGTSIPSKND